MKIKEIISQLKSVEEYVLNNDDYCSGYDVCVQDQLIYNQNGNKDFSQLTKILDYCEINYKAELLPDIWSAFLDDMRDPYYLFDSKVLNMGYSSDYEYTLCSFDIGEYEHQLNAPLTKDQAEELNDSTDWYATKNSDLVYLNLSGQRVSYIVRDKQEIIDWFDDVMEGLV